MSTMSIVLLVIAVLVVVAVIVGVVLVLNKRNRVHKHHQAEALREEAAVTKTPAIQESELHAQEAEARAERTRLQAERAEHEAAAARQGVDVEQAQYEDRIREADRVDPAVDHSAPDYTPDTTAAEQATPAEQTTETRPETGGRHTV
jgi:uncharacterized protein HemX